MASAALTLDSLPRNPRESVKQVVRAAHKQLTWAAALHENVEGALAAGAFAGNHVTHADQRTALAPAIRQQLVDFYRPHNEALFKMLGYRITDWSGVDE